MPESVKGIRWEHERCPCILPHLDAPVEDRPALGGNHRNGSDVGGRQWQHAPDPACPTCHGTGRLEALVLRRGSWRHTRSHEAVLMLTKDMGYWANGEAVREEATMQPQRRSNGHSVLTYNPPGRQAPNRGDRGVKDTPSVDGPGGRNPRSVLTPASAPSTLEHYAQFPEGLIAPLIKASVPAQCCGQCGAGYAPVVSHTGQQRQTPWTGAGRNNGCIAGGGHYGRTGSWTTDTTRHGDAPTCACVTDAPPVPGRVLDPFAGSGTTLAVARALGRRAIGLEASPTYTALAHERLGLADLDAWQHGEPTRQERFDDLPLFRG